MRKTVAILGIPIDDLDREQVLERIDEFIASRRFHQVATANTDFLIKALGDPELKNILVSADLVVPDGMPIVLASRWLKAGLRERVTGADMVPDLAKRAAGKGYRIFMLGARPEVAAQAKARLEADNPGLQIVGCVSPPVASIVAMDNEALLDQIDAARPDILLVAFGNPKQEKWIHMHRRRLRVPVCIGVGGSFDFVAGAVARAPEWMQRSGLEWIHRLGQEPQRLWKRYVEDIVHFARLMALELWVMRRGDAGAEPRLKSARIGDCTVISAIGPFGKRLLSQFQFAADEALNEGTHLILDLHPTTRVDSAVLGTLLNLPKRAAYVGREVRLVGLNRRLRMALRVSHTEDLFRIFPNFPEALCSAPSEDFLTNLTVGETEAVLAIRGSASGECAAQVEQKLREIPTGVSFIDLDLRAATYIDSAMLAALRRYADQKGRANTQVRLIAGDSVRRALTRERLDGLFDLADTPRAVVPAKAIAVSA